MAIADLNYRSYFSVFTKGISNFSISAFSPFDSSAYSRYDYETVSSSDISYTPNTGRIKFTAPGDYLIFACINFSVSGANTTAVMTIEQNDTAVYTTSDLKVYSTVDPRQMVGHIVISVSRGDTVRIRVDGDDSTSRTIGISEGSHFMAIKANGFYSNAFYTADSLGQTDSNYDLFASREGGEVNSKTKGVEYNRSSGEFTPSATRKFLTLSTQHYENSASRYDLEHRIMIRSQDSEVVDYGVHAAIDPLTHTIGYALSISDGTPIRVNNTQGRSGGDTYKILKGTCLTMFDISNRGADPSSFLSISTTVSSGRLSINSGDQDVFDQSNYRSSTMVKTDRLAETGVVYTPVNGRFTASEAGTYLFLLNLTMVPTDAQGTAPIIKVNKNDSAFYVASTQLQQHIKPVGWTGMFLANLGATDYLNVIIHDLGGYIDAHGSSVTIIKIDESGGGRKLFLQRQASKLVGDDYTLRTFDREVAGYQSDNVLNNRVPFSKAVTGPRNLRGRTTAYAPSLGSKTKK